MPTVAIWEKLVLSILQQKFISPWYEKIFEQIVHPMQPQTMPAVADLKMSSIAKVGSGNPGNLFHCIFGLFGTHLPLYQSKLAGQQLDQSTDRPSTTNRVLVGRVYNNIIKTLMSLYLIIFPKSVFIHKYCFVLRTYCTTSTRACSDGAVGFFFILEQHKKQRLQHLSGIYEHI